MRLRILSINAAVTLLLVGCATGQKFSQLHPGMTKPQMVMIIEIFVAQDQAMNPLTDKLFNALFNAVFDITLVSVVDETVGKIL